VRLVFADLAWLRPPPSDFRARLRAARDAAPAAAWDEARRLAGYALDETQLSQLARLAGGLEAGGEVPVTTRLAILGDGTLDLLGPAIAASAVRTGLRLEVVTGHYASAVADALDPASAVRASRPDLALVACDRRALGLDAFRASDAEAEAAVESAFAVVRSIVDGLRPSVGAAILVQTVVPPVEALFGSLDQRVAGSPAAMVARLNTRIAAFAADTGLAVVDIARLAGWIGLEAWDAPRHWHASKLPFAPHLIPAYADVVARTLGAVMGRSRKCLVLDLDNTLWGGVIGDDGVAGIKLGQGSADGEAFLAIQQMALALRNRGVVLAVCSKNEDDAARSPFRDHAEMVLKENHVAVFQANWVDKAANLKAIAETLNIGVDALVFLDDNPAERDQIRRELPMVAVPELPADPALYPRTLMAAGYFEAVAFSDEDRSRAEAYQANAERAALAGSASNMGDYLRSLDMTCRIRRFDATGRARISQLTNKSNQYNLTTRRYSEAQIAAVEADPSRYAVQVNLADRFGDNGMISVVIAGPSGPDDWEVDTWLMSCRVLNRRVEEAVLASLAAAARAAGARRLVGRYLPTAKNRMVADHYGKLGFTLVEGSPEQGSVWALDLAGHAPTELPMTIEDLTADLGRPEHTGLPGG
jgi:FkbH-like protein